MTETPAAETRAPSLTPIIKTVDIMASAPLVFDTFVSHIGTWWPLARFSRSRGAPPKALVLEQHEGGLIYEVSEAGERLEWGRVEAIDPPRSILMAWHLGRPVETRVLVTFEAIGGSHTLVRLEHSGWERLEAIGATVERQGYDDGWEVILHHGFASLAVARASSAA